MSATVLQFPKVEREPRVGLLATVLWIFTVLGMALWVGLIAALGVLVGALL